MYIMPNLLNNLQFRLSSTLTTSWTSVSITNDIERDQVVSFTDAYIVFTNRTGSVIERAKGNASGWILTLTKRWLDQSKIDTEVTSLKQERTAWTRVYVTILSSQLADRQNSNYFYGNQNHSGIVWFNWYSDVGRLQLPRLTIAQRDALSNVVNGEVIYNTDTWVLQQYIAGSWNDVWNTWTPNASTTVAGKVEIATDSEVGSGAQTGWSWAELVINPTSVVKSSSGASDENKIPALNAQWQLDDWFIDSQWILSLGAESLSDYDTYIPWEDVAQGETLFVEDMVAFADADQEQNIGDVSWNTRVSIEAFWSGVAASTLKLSLRKETSPSVDLELRIETDNAWVPSGTLVDPNATATVTGASLTTSLADTTVTLAGSITIVKWTKVHIVLAQASDTVNGTNYYVVWYDAINTSTRPLNLYDGASYGTPDNDKYVYVDSDLFEEKLLSLTDASYIYKLPTDIPRIAIGAVSAWEECPSIYRWLADYFSGLTADTTYYLSDTPWTISATPWTNNYPIGKAISDSILDVRWWQWVVWDDYSISNNTLYQASSDWIIVLNRYVDFSSDWQFDIVLYVDETDATTEVYNVQSTNQTFLEWIWLTYPIKKWQYYKFVSTINSGTESSWSSNYKFIPLS